MDKLIFWGGGLITECRDRNNSRSKGNGRAWRGKVRGILFKNHQIFKGGCGWRVLILWYLKDGKWVNILSADFWYPCLRVVLIRAACLRKFTIIKELISGVGMGGVPVANY